MVPRCLTVVGPLLFTLAVVNAAAELSPVPQLAKRNPYYGGFALSQGATNCPSSTQTCNKGFCCPANTWCSENINGPYCCPTPDDCGTLVNDQPTCADPSWTLYTDAYAFCCTSDHVGIQGEQCQPKSLTFSSGLYAATSQQANTALPPSTRAGSTGSAGATNLPSGTNAGSATATKTGIGGVLNSLGAAASSAIGKSAGERSVADGRTLAVVVAGGWFITSLCVFS